jgi:hypothetical protein
MAQAKVINPNRDLAAAIKAIKKVEPDLIRQMQKDMRRAAAPTIKSIKDYALWLDPDLTPFNNSGDSNILKGELIKGRGGARHAGARKPSCVAFESSSVVAHASHAWVASSTPS